MAEMQIVTNRPLGLFTLADKAVIPYLASPSTDSLSFNKDSWLSRKGFEIVEQGSSSGALFLANYQRANEEYAYPNARTIKYVGRRYYLYPDPNTAGGFTGTTFKPAATGTASSLLSWEYRKDWYDTYGMVGWFIKMNATAPTITYATGTYTTGVTPTFTESGEYFVQFGCFNELFLTRPLEELKTLYEERVATNGYTPYADYINGRTYWCYPYYFWGFNTCFGLLTVGSGTTSFTDEFSRTSWGADWNESVNSPATFTLDGSRAVYDLPSFSGGRKYGTAWCTKDFTSSDLKARISGLTASTVNNTIPQVLVRADNATAPTEFYYGYASYSASNWQYFLFRYDGGYTGLASQIDTGNPLATTMEIRAEDDGSGGVDVGLYLNGSGTPFI